jgi:mRNA (guanine-N(7))-methyltransferase domain/mRNA capping enzyme, C-terminal domain
MGCAFEVSLFFSTFVEKTVKILIPNFFLSFVKIEIYLNFLKIFRTQQYNIVQNQMSLLSKIEGLMKKTTPPPPKASPPKPSSRKPASGELIDEASIKDINKFFNLPKETEVELSFGKFLYKNGRLNFIPGVTQGEFEELLKILQKSNMGESSSSEDKVEIDENTHIRKITRGSAVVWQKKERSREKIENIEWGYRISSSKEIAVDPPKNFKATRTRNRKRFSFQWLDGKYQFDLTQITSPDTPIVYEVEIERIKKDKGVIKNLKVAIETVLLGLIGKDRSSDTRILMGADEKENAVNAHNSLFYTDKYVRAPQNPFNLVEGYWNKPQNIKKDDILLSNTFDFSVTVKLDGKRKFLLITNNTLYVCAPPYDIKVAFKDPNLLRPLKNTLLDCEEVEGRYYVFDILFYKGEDVRGGFFKERKELVKNVVGETNLNIVTAKPFFTDPDFYKMTKMALKELKKLSRSGIPTDGLIFQPGHYYKNKQTKKWKPVDQLTIDFKLGDKKGRTFLAYVAKYDKNVRKDVLFKGSHKNPISENVIIQLPKGKFKGLNLEGMVVECKYDHDEQVFIIERLREDKAGVPNEINVAMSVWDDIMDPIRVETLKGDDLIIMRRMHNLCKSSLLEQTFKKGDIIMDWGSGRGGDLTKWEKIGISKVFVVEPNKDNYKILSDRKKDMKMKTNIVSVMNSKKELVGGQNTKDLLETIHEDQVNGLVSFFSLTFFGKDKETFNSGIESISKVLPNKGDMFIGVVMDSKETLKLTKGFQYKNKAFSITPLEKTSRSPKKGNNEIQITINDPSSMVDYTEWLFPFELFKERLESEGFQCEKDGYLNDSGGFPKISLKGKEYTLSDLYNNLGEDAQNFSSLNRFFVFKRAGKAKKSAKALDKTPSPKKSSKKRSPKKSLDEFEKVKVVDNSFFHAFLSAFDKKYIGMDKKGKRARVEKVKKMLAEQLTMDIFKNLAKGCVFDAEIKKAILDEDLEEDDDFTLEAQALENFQEEIQNKKDIDYRKIMSHVANLVKININVLGDKKMKTKPKFPKSVYLLDKDEKIYLLKKGDRVMFGKDEI